MKTVHIISHSHWDREWYMPYEQHHMRLINLIDDVLAAIDNDPDFKSFHLDGQTICIADYLEVKPQMRDKLFRAIKNGKIKIGPWYILQDAFLTSSEANVRNLLYGDLDCQRYGAKTSVGYFPDTFGIYSQAPQILKQGQINNMIFGRGVSTTGFNNQVSSDFESKFSEMKIQADNGDEVLGILFANWYSNANEIPTSPLEAKKYWDQKLADCMRYTDSDHLLMMNGCDHTPYQKDVTTAIKVANELYSEYNFIHSNFDDYLNAIETEVENKELTVIKNELISQTTDGYYTLVNTASSRINQKIKNAKIQAKYEYLVEPLAALYQGANYPHEKIEYGWKKLMQNHPHDSICGCSVDSVHQTIDNRFADSENVADYLIEESLKTIKNQINNQEHQLAFAIINPGTLSNNFHQVEIEIDRELFNDSFVKAREKMQEIKLKDYQVIDVENNVYPAKITDLGLKFGYILPDDIFRRAYYSRNILIEFSAEIPNFSHKTFYLKETELPEKTNDCINNQLENELIAVEINPDCSINIVNKITNKSIKSLMRIIDHGDVGNEYMFGRVVDDKNIYNENYHQLINADCGAVQKRIVKTKIIVPKSADDLLAKEQLEIVEYKDRQAKRSKEMVELELTITYQLTPNDPGINITIDFENSVKDHRMRVEFTPGFETNWHEAETAFNIIKRSNEVTENWQNPSNDQRMLNFVRMNDQEMELTIATNGLHEYEHHDSTLDITICRSVGELGDWGHFITPEAQELKPISAEFKVYFQPVKISDEIANKSRTAFVKQPYVQLDKSVGKLNPNHQMLELELENSAYVSAIKRNFDNELIIRMVSNGKNAKYNLGYKYYQTDLLEQVVNPVTDNQIPEASIVSMKVIDYDES